MRIYYEDLNEVQRAQVAAMFHLGNPRAYSYEIGTSGRVLSRRAVEIGGAYLPDDKSKDEAPDVSAYELTSETLGSFDNAYSKARDALGAALATANPYQSQLMPLFDAMTRSVVELLLAYIEAATSGTEDDDAVSDYFANAAEALTAALATWRPS